MAVCKLGNQFVVGQYGCTGGTGVTSNTNVRVCGKIGTMSGYLQVTSARVTGNVIVTIPRTLTGSSSLALVSNSDNTCRLAYANADGTVTAAGNVPTGFYSLVGTVFFS